MILRPALAAFALLLAGCSTVPVPADQPIDAVWNRIAIPAAPPATAPITVPAATSALLVLDMYPRSCNAVDRPSCPATIPRIAALLEAARASEMDVIYGAGPPSANQPTDAVPELARREDEALVRGPADKFVDSGLEALLRERGIQTLIITGTSADGAVLYTASSAALRGFQVVVPIDAMSSKDRFAELYTMWHLANGSATITRNIQLSRSAEITIQ